MISKLIDEPYWDEMEEVSRFYFKPSKKRKQYLNENEEEIISDFVGSFLNHFDLVNVEVEYMDALLPLILKHVEKNGFVKIKEDLVEAFIEYYESHSYYFLIDSSDSLEERRDLEQYLRETNNIQEILETYQMYFSLLDESLKP